MMTRAMKLFCRISGKNKFTDNDIESIQETAALKAADRNPYSWNMEFLPYEDGSGYEARFIHCGICSLMKKLRLSEYSPAMCQFDYTMSEALWNDCRGWHVPLLPSISDLQGRKGRMGNDGSYHEGKDTW